jgi:DNA-binding transcriptional LysR family regulator
MVRPPFGSVHLLPAANRLEAAGMPVYAAKMQDMDWNDLRYALAAARGGTLSAAAKRLGVDETTVARRIARIERRLGVALFERTAGRLEPTGAGATLLAHAERVESEVGALETALTGTDRIAAGSVRLTAVPILINRVLAPAAGALLAAHPGLRLELVAEPRNLSLSRRETDMALRLARPSREAAAVARRVGRLDYGVYARADLAGEDLAGEDLPWIGYGEEMADIPQARWIAGASRGEPRLRVNDAEAMLQAVRAGLGRALLPCAIAGRDPALARLDGPAPALSREAWLMIHPDLRGVARIRAVADWVAATVAGLG